MTDNRVCSSHYSQKFLKKKENMYDQDTWCWCILHSQRFWISSLLPVLSEQMVPCGQNMSLRCLLTTSPVPTHRTVLTGHYYSRFMSRFSTPYKLPGCEVSSQFSQQNSPQIRVRVINRARQMESQPLAITCNKTRIFCNKLLLRTFNQHLHFAKQLSNE